MALTALHAITSGEGRSLPSWVGLWTKVLQLHRLLKAIQNSICVQVLIRLMAVSTSALLCS